MGRRRGPTRTTPDAEGRVTTRALVGRVALALLVVAAVAAMPRRRDEVAASDRASSGVVTDEAGLRSAVERVAPGATAEIHLAATHIVRTDRRPLVVRGHVSIVGEGSTGSIIDAAHQGQVFEVARGAVLTLRAVALAGGRRDAAGAASEGQVVLTDVLVARAPHVSGAELAADRADTMQSMPQSCWVGMLLDSQYFASARITDPTALAGVLGDPF